MKNVKNTIYFGLILLLLFSLYLWKCTCSFKDFGLNLFTEVLGIVITVFFIEKIIEKNEKNEKIPLTVAAYTDIRLLVNRYISFFQELYRNSVNENEPLELENLLSINTAEKIWNNLDMNAKPHVFPVTNMWIHFDNTAKDFIDKGNIILNRHGWHLDSNVYKYVHDITESQLITSWKAGMISIYSLDNSEKYPRPKILSEYSISPTQEEFDSVLKLYEWCSKINKELGKEYELSNLIDYQTIDFDKRIFSYRKEEAQLKKENEEWNKFREK